MLDQDFRRTMEWCASLICQTFGISEQQLGVARQDTEDKIVEGSLSYVDAESAQQPSPLLLAGPAGAAPDR